MTVPAPDVLRAEIDRRLADSAARVASAQAGDGWWPQVAEVEEATVGYLTAFRAILDEHADEEGYCLRCAYGDAHWLDWPCPTVRAVAAALTREDQ